MISSLAFTCLCSCPVILHNLGAIGKSKKLINQQGFDEMKKISVRQGFITGTPIKKIGTDDFVINSIKFYAQKKEHMLFGFDLKTKHIGEEFDEKMNISEDIKVDNEYLDPNRIKNIFYREENEIFDSKICSEYPSIKSIPEGLKHVHFKHREYGLKNKDRVFLLKENDDKDCLTIATFESKNKLVQYIASKYYDKIPWITLLIYYLIAIMVIATNDFF